MNNEGKALLAALLDAINKGDAYLINKLKYDNLFYGSNLLSVVSNYIFLSNIGIDFDFGSHVIKKGTKLYRIRTFNDQTDFSKPSEWTFPPSKLENRGNIRGEKALYVGTTENVCLLETHIAKGEKYVLAEYVVTEDITVGGYLDCEDRKKYSWYIAGVILNAFLIAPARSQKNSDLFKYLDEQFVGLTVNDIQIQDARKLDLPLKFGVINKKEQFYQITNKLFGILKKRYGEGVIYSSCYMPMSTVGIECSDNNIVLYESAFGKIRFQDYKIKNNIRDFGGKDLIELLVNTLSKNLKKK